MISFVLLILGTLYCLCFVLRFLGFVSRRATGLGLLAVRLWSAGLSVSPSCLCKSFLPMFFSLGFDF
jgi:hypothetical protein